VHSFDNTDSTRIIMSNRHHISLSQAAQIAEQAEAHRAAARASAWYIRKGHVVRRPSGEVAYTGMSPQRVPSPDPDRGVRMVNLPSINAAKRWIRAEQGQGRPVSITER